jgi:hypothetical protein
MPCCDKHAQDAVLFHRKSLQVGAAFLFDNAIKEAGITKATKFIVFRMWKNGFLQRQIDSRKMNRVVVNISNIKIMRGPFHAWRKFTTSSAVSRKDKQIVTLEQKLVLAEAQLNSVSAAKRIAEEEVR